MKPQYGDRRFACECGARYTEGATALAHAFEGHEVVREEFHGRWDFVSRVPVMDYLVDRLRLRGESLGDFLLRLQSRADELEALAGQYEEGASFVLPDGKTLRPDGTPE